MRRAARVDSNHAEIVAALRRVGAATISLAQLGDGVPDLLVCYHRTLFLLEVKDGSKRPSERSLTAEQVVWHRNWPGPVAVVLDVSGALSAIGASPARDRG